MSAKRPRRSSVALLPLDETPSKRLKATPKQDRRGSLREWRSPRGESSDSLLSSSTISRRRSSRLLASIDNEDDIDPETSPIKGRSSRMKETRDSVSTNGSAKAQEASKRMLRRTVTEEPAPKEQTKRMTRRTVTEELVSSKGPPKRTFKRTVTEELVPKMNKVELNRRKKVPARSVQLPAVSDSDEESDEDREHIGDQSLQLDAEDGYDSDTKPVRSLESFSVYSSQHEDAVDFMELYNCHDLEKSHYFITGLANTVLVEGEHDDRDKAVRVRLTQLDDLNVHDFDDTDYNTDVYIETPYAWYILGKPNPEYHQKYTPYLVKHDTMQWCLELALELPNLSYGEYLAKLFPFTEKPNSSVIKCGNHRMNRREYTKNVEKYIYTQFSKYWQAKSFGLPEFILEMKSYHAATVDSGCTTSDAEFNPSVTEDQEDNEDSDSETAYSDDSDLEQLRPKTTTTPSASWIKRDPGALIKTLVTPTVYATAKILKAHVFERNLRCVGPMEEMDVSMVSGDDILAAHEDDPAHIEPLDHYFTAKDGTQYFSGVSIDGVVYRVGDYVAMEPGEDENDERRANDEAPDSVSANLFVNRAWFGQLIYVSIPGYQSEDHGVVMFHHTWLVHGSKTLLKEAAPPQELYQLDSQCDDSPVASILTKINVERIQQGVNPLDHTMNKEDFYLRFVWDEDELSYCDIPGTPDLKDTIHGDNWKSSDCCNTCRLREDKEKRFTETLLDDRTGFTFGGQTFHLREFIFLRKGRGVPAQARPADAGTGDAPPYDDDSEGRSVLGIGQILRVKRAADEDDMGLRLKVEVRMLSRSNPNDIRCLEYTSDVLAYPLAAIDGVAFVKCFSEDDDDYKAKVADWTDSSQHHFYVQPSEFWMSCDICIEEETRQTASLAEFPPLRTLELFSGAGGLSLGLEASGATTTVAAVERDESAALSFFANHPDATVFNEDINKFVAAYMDGNEQPTLHGVELPRTGSIQLVAGGPPCQSFSMANNNKRQDDVRSTMPCSFLSVVEIHQPDYVLIENVRGFLHYSIPREDGSVIRHGMVKYMFSALLALGYQIRYAVPDAIQFGAPQTRRRIIFLAAKCGVPLPKFPTPTHTYPTAQWNKSPLVGHSLPLLTRSLLRNCDEADLDDRYHTEAPHAYVTIDDASSDLPPWDWAIPEPTPQDLHEMEERAANGIQSFPTVREGPQTLAGHLSLVNYITPPQNRYQAWLRQRATDRVSRHYTMRYNAVTVERVVRIPLRPNANSDDLPDHIKKNLPERMIRDRDTTHKKIFFGRNGGDSYWRTIMTTHIPGERGIKNLHPHNKRLYSVRELARGQGFPDTFRLKSAKKTVSAKCQDYCKQIGNAVPVPLSMAFGRSFLESQRELRERRSRNIREMSCEV